MAKKPTKSAAPKVAKPAKAAPKSAAKVAAKTVEKTAAPVKSGKVAEKAAKPKSTVTPTTLESVTDAPVAVEKPVKKSKKELKKEVADAAISAEANKRWVELKNKHGGEKALPYNMTAEFAAHSCMVHKKFGWGFVLTNDNDRLEVLFEHGSKHLISNYKG